MAELKASGRVTGIPPSSTLAVMDKARKLKAQGEDVVSLAAGEPDFDTPGHIVEAGIQALREGLTRYAPARGIPELTEAIARKLREENGVEADPAKGIMVVPGGKMALFAAIAALVDPGDEAVYLEPGWVSYEPMVLMAGGQPVPVGLRHEDGFALDPERLAAHITSRTKLLILNSPSNPTGMLLGRSEMEAVRELAVRHNLIVISDEIYERLVFGEKEFVSAASLDGMKERTLTVNGFSKAYAMTGWRLGYVTGPPALITQILKVQEHSTTCATTFVQKAAVAALEGPQTPITDMVAAFKRRRDFFVAGLNDIPGVSCLLPGGTFYAFPRFETRGK
ncbi:MAG: pyridoxal phosphate-dependent aminotransferase, partial [Firmicutes bacterium]|nr:pyridoxal phosphate-dependent aminotransferase [Bacillota bacterium]